MDTTLRTILAASLISTGALAQEEWTDLGCAHAGIAGVPVLAGNGALEANHMVTLDLNNAAPGAPALLFLSTSSNPTAFAGGMLKALPSAGPPIAISVVTSVAGTIPISAVAPPNVPSGLPFYFQYAIADATASEGVALSNAVRAYTPTVKPVLSGFSPGAGGVGTTIDVDGDFFGDDEYDLCALLMNEGGVVGLSRVRAASDESFDLELEAVLPGATSGRIGVLRGTGSTYAFPPNPNYTEPEPAWVFMGEGAPTVSSASFQFTPFTGLSGPCQTVWLSLNPSGTQWRAQLPFKTTDKCQPGATMWLGMDATFTDGVQIGLDEWVSLGLAAEQTGAECAAQICARWAFAMNKYLTDHGHTDYFITCTTQIVGEDIFIIFPNNDLTPFTTEITQYDSVSGAFQVCPR